MQGTWTEGGTGSRGRWRLIHGIQGKIKSSVLSWAITTPHVSPGPAAMPPAQLGSRLLLRPRPQEQRVDCGPHGSQDKGIVNKAKERGERRKQQRKKLPAAHIKTENCDAVGLIPRCCQERTGSAKPEPYSFPTAGMCLSMLLFPPKE